MKEREIIENLDTKIILALIASIISFIGLIISKEQKISDFRQKWINDMREDISSFVGHVMKYTMSWWIERPESKDDIKKFLEKNLSLVYDMENLHTRIGLRLNPQDDKNIKEKMDNIFSIIKTPSKEKMSLEITNEINDLLEIMHKLLKKEWKRVKNGEPIFRLSKVLFFLLIVISLIYFPYQYYKEKNSLNTISNQDINSTISNKTE